MANPYGKYRLHLKNFRAIEEADITLDGITVVAGINACGKSTISRLFYETFRCASNFREIAFEKFAKKCYEMEEELRDFIYFYKLAKLGGKENIPAIDRRGRFNLKRFLVSFDKKGIESVVDSIQNAREAAKAAYKSPYLKLEARRLARSLMANKVLFNRNSVTRERFQIENLVEVLDRLERELCAEFDEIERRVLARDIDILRQEIAYVFPELLDSERLPLDDETLFEFYDAEGKVTDKKNNIFAPISGVKETFYYDAPQFYLNASNTTQPYYQAVKKVLNDDERKIQLSEEIIYLNKEFMRFARGQAWVEKDWGTEKFWFGREDGRRFPMRDCATGLKSVGLLQMLMNKGALTETTAVFLDEPEAYLHPEWIVEYARMLVLINKFLGTRFFIATHNPDMVSAIRFISEKEETLDLAHFYVAKESSASKFRYSYTEAQDDEKSIEPIFKSFATALDKITEYSTDNEEFEDE